MNFLPSKKKSTNLLNQRQSQSQSQSHSISQTSSLNLIQDLNKINTKKDLKKPQLYENFIYIVITKYGCCVI